MSEDTRAMEEKFGETFIMPKTSQYVDRIFTTFMSQRKPFGFITEDEDLEYHPLPYKPGSDDDLLLPEPWRVVLELQTEDNHCQRMGLDLYGDLVLGRGESTPGCIMLDLEPYGATDFGVSRVHAKLRPTPRQLFIIDQGSTNKTIVDGTPSGQGRATSITDGAMVTLGGMMLLVHIVGKPKSAG